MNDFVRCNKVNGVYWLKNPIDTLTVKITTKQHDGFIQLPKFDQNNEPDTSEHKSKEFPIDEVIFKWQEKIFSRHEIEKYSNVHNCITDAELGYFELLENTQHVGSKIFTYINEDYYRPSPMDSRKEKQTEIPFLSSCFENLNLKGDKKFGRVFNDGSHSMTHLFRSNEEISLENQHWMSMYVVYDSSQYNEDSQLLLKRETTLLSLSYNAMKNCLILSPDTNDLVFNPYSVDGNGTGLQYAIEIGYGEQKYGEELVKLLNKLYKKWEKKQKQLVNFSAPPLGKKWIYITFEIMSAKRFESDNIYMEYHIKIPDDIQCKGTLNGKTHTTRALETEDTEEWHYGHTVDLEMEISTGIEPPPIKIYLEVISVDWWGRHRTEGYATMPLGLRPGWHARTLACIRPEELDTVEAETRRFFLGGCHLIKDLDILDDPSQSTHCSWRTTGSVHVRWSTVGQGAARGPPAGDCGADAALRRYRRAVAALAAARELYTEPEQ